MASKTDEAPTRVVILCAWILNLPRSGFLFNADEAVGNTPLVLDSNQPKHSLPDPRIGRKGPCRHRLSQIEFLQDP